MNRRSLTFRLVSWYCGLLALLGIAFAGYTYFNVDRYFERVAYDLLTTRTNVLWSVIQGFVDDEPQVAATIQQLVIPEAQNRFIRVTVNDRVIYRSGPPQDGSFNPEDIPLPDKLSLPDFDQIESLNIYIYAKRFVLPDGRIVIFESGQTAQPTYDFERRMIGPLLIGLPLLLAFAGVAGYILIQRALGPVEAMIGAAEAITFNSPRNRLPLAGTGDRFDALAQTLNRMLERLDNAYQHVSRFSGDAAHELRTPLTIIRGEIELLAAAPIKSEDVPAALGNILEETTRLSQTVENLITLAHLDAMAGKQSHESLDLTALATDTIDQMRLLADEKNITLRAPTGPSVKAAGDRARLKQVLVNLLDNAIKYTPAGGNVTVTTTASEGSAVLSVTDTGIGISPEHTSLIFNRFFRVATTRGEAGAGLGLAIVRSICRAHGGNITVTSKLGGGSTFRVTLPLATVSA